jgi:hypothetical protein
MEQIDGLGPDAALISEIRDNRDDRDNRDCKDNRDNIDNRDVSLLHWMREVKSANKRPNLSKWPSRVKRNSRLRLPKVSKQHAIEMFS